MTAFSPRYSEVGCLRLISDTKDLVIPFASGLQTVASSTDVFSYIDSDYSNWGLDSPSGQTSPLPVQVFEMADDVMFTTMFESFGVELDRLFLTQHQIRNFVRDHSD